MVQNSAEIINSITESLTLSLPLWPHLHVFCSHLSSVPQAASSRLYRTHTFPIWMSEFCQRLSHLRAVDRGLYLIKDILMLTIEKKEDHYCKCAKSREPYIFCKVRDESTIIAASALISSQEQFHLPQSFLSVPYLF